MEDKIYLWQGDITTLKCDAIENKLESIAFCCISTGVFGFPNELAGEIAVNTVRDYKKNSKTKLEVIFKVYMIY